MIVQGNDASVYKCVYAHTLSYPQCPHLHSARLSSRGGRHVAGAQGPLWQLTLAQGAAGQQPQLLGGGGEEEEGAVLQSSLSSKSSLLFIHSGQSCRRKVLD